MDLSVHNLAIYSAQVLVVVSAATMGATLFRLAPSRARLIYWRAVVLLCLLLPLLPVRSVDVIAPSTVAVSAALSEPSVAVRNTLSRAPTLPNLITGMLIIGAMARSLWLGLGLLRAQTSK